MITKMSPPPPVGGGTLRLYVFILTIPLLVLSLVGLSLGIWTSCEPQVTVPPPVSPGGPGTYDILRVGTPTTFLTTLSVSTSPYLLVDSVRQSALFHEYVLVGPGYRKGDPKLVYEGSALAHEEEEILLLLYEEDDITSWKFEPDIVQQNLGKELLWSMMNSSGMLPAMTVVNTTYKEIFKFHTDPGDTGFYNMPYPLPRSLVTVPPFDVIIEFPGESREFRTLKTLIDYFSVGLLRWRYSIAPPVPMRSLFPDLASGMSVWPLEFSDPLNFTEACTDTDQTTFGNDLLCAYQKRFKRLENPCIKDMFLFYLIRGVRGSISEPKKYSAVNKLYITVPMVFELLHHKGWYDLTPVYCPRPEDHEECGEPKDVMLTNDHLLILTDKGLWVSASLNSSRENASLPYILKPLLKFTPIDPCAKFSNFNCSEVGSSMLSRQLMKRQRLFYTPVCHLFQYPYYDDVVILAIDHISQSPDLKEERDVFSIIYSAKPYNDWKILFHARHEYETTEGMMPIKEVIGVFFNHHRRHFDICLLLNDVNQFKTGGNNIIFIIISEWSRENDTVFILPEPTELDFLGYPELHGLLGNGHLEFEFPPSFHMTKLVVNPEPLDVFFLGNQIWVSETGNPFAYISMPYVLNYYGEPSFIDSCSFNHPDRTYICVEKSNEVVLIGRVGLSYSPIPVKYATIIEFNEIMLINVWPVGYRKHIVWSGHFIAGYSGKVMLWYLYNEINLVPLQEEALKNLTSENDCKLIKDPLECQICARLWKYKERKCVPVIEEGDPQFRMMALDPATFQARDTAQDGPLVPYMIDGDKGIIFEAEVPSTIPGFYPDRNYMHGINTGNTIYCRSQTAGTRTIKPPLPISGTCHPLDAQTEQSDCEMYIRHIKKLHREGETIFLEGFRSSLFVHIVKPPPMYPIPTDLIVLIIKGTNHAIVQLDTFWFEPGKHFHFRYGHIGQTLYIPEQFSVLLEGFPAYQTQGDLIHNFTRMVGVATRHFRQGARIQVQPFRAFLINLKTDRYCDFQHRGYQLGAKNNSLELHVAAYDKRRYETDIKRNKDLKLHQSVMNKIISKWPTDGQNTKPMPADPHKITSYQQVEELLLFQGARTIGGEITRRMIINPKLYVPPIRKHFKCEDDPEIWSIVDGGCHLRLFLVDNPVIKQGGGRVSLDKHDSLSFTVKLRSLTPLGKSLTHRPLIGITNTNPKVLQVEKKEQFGGDPQTMDITLTPTGFQKGVATVSVRPFIVSTRCPFSDGGFTIIVQVHRAEGRRLHVNYPIPTCKAKPGEGVQRPWKVDLPTCITRNELLEDDAPEGIIRRPDTPIGQIFFKNLAPNYRPPSLRGAEIPLSRNVYNVHPELPKYKDTYRISKETSVISQCFGKAKRKDCLCSPNDELSDDVLFTDCKRKVYRVKRGHKIEISAEYDRVMRDEDQNAEFFSPKKNWSLFVEEVNDRVEFALSSKRTKYLDTVNNETEYHEGRKYYDMKDLRVTLHGTGLFHFRVGLADFESFDDVTGYFMLFCDDSELNHVQLVVIMLLTITICMVFVFLGFLIVRNRLSSQLPFQTSVKNKVKLE
ncbi:Cation channel sperm-associated protein subunit beta [Orchesella cincta]|uniref:Cation channel sperm-associated protein subunit beta n=1 Tax=Orchesella cincta TaxID=48709 RepID=A0A1D2MP58_ORCCI|nr:Cation channel sperm-associated protein subunit beta [Orchesella cincta]